MRPTDLHPGLKLNRLETVAKIIRRARREAVARHDKTLGDNAWVLGCRAYAWTCHALVRAASEHPTWLTIVEGGGRIRETDSFWTGLRFVFAVGGVPLRFYRGEPEDVPDRTAKTSFPEIRTRQMAFAFRSGGEVDTTLRLAVETDDDGEVTQVTLVQVDEAGEVVGESWALLSESQETNVTQFPTKEEGKDLGKPQVASRKKAKREPEEVN